MAVNVNFLNCLMSTLGQEFDGSDEDHPHLYFQEIPLFTDPSELVSGTCYVDVDEMNTPGILEGRFDPEMFDFAVTLMPIWDIGKVLQADPTMRLSTFRSTVEQMIGTLKYRQWSNTGTIMEIFAQQMGVGDPLHPTHIAWEITFHLDVGMDLEEVWYYPPNVTPVTIRSITSIVRLAP